MVKITAEEQNKGKRMKRNEDSLRDIWDSIKCNNMQIIGVPEDEKEQKVSQKIFKEIIVENFPNMGKESHPSSGSREDLTQNKLKEKYTKTHIIHTEKN